MVAGALPVPIRQYIVAVKHDPPTLLTVPVGMFRSKHLTSDALQVQTGDAVRDELQSLDNQHKMNPDGPFLTNKVDLHVDLNRIAPGIIDPL